MASDRILTQQYTAVICIAVCSVTRLPELLDPKKKLYADPGVEFVGLSLDLKNVESIFIIFLMTFLKVVVKKAPCKSKGA